MLSDTAQNIRRIIIETVKPEITHHIGSSLSCIEILTALYFDVLNISVENWESQEKDYFILSKGHGALALYSTLFYKGFIDKKTLESFDCNGSFVCEHATTEVRGIELSTGSLGHGIPVGNGIALSLKNSHSLNKVYVLISDGELNEGSNWEAFAFAVQHKLNNLCVILDMNGWQGFGKTGEVLDLSPVKNKFEAFGLKVWEVDGHDINEIVKFLNECKEEKEKPQIILANTIKGKGISFMENKLESHYLSLSEKEKMEILKNL